jgi:hypothetical protein
VLSERDFISATATEKADAASGYYAYFGRNEVDAKPGR